MNTFIKKIKRFISEKGYRTRVLAGKGFYKKMTDEQFLKKQFKDAHGYPLDLENPKTYNEKLQWAKLYDRDPKYTALVDKYEVKRIVAGLIGEEYVVKNYGVWNSFDEIDFDKLPDKFVLKCTHDSGGVFVCRDKSEKTLKAARKKMEKHLKRDYYMEVREYPYKDVERRIIAEEYLIDESGYELKDYKFFCFDGVPEFMYVALDRNVKGKETKFDFYDMDFRLLPFTNGHPNSGKRIEKPACFDEMKAVAAKLSKGIPHVRVDLYNVNGKVYFGEMTFSHMSGFTPFEPPEWDRIFGDMIVLPERTEKTK